MVSKTKKRQNARDVRSLLSLYQYTLERWYADEHTDEETRLYQLHLLRLAQGILHVMIARIDY